MKNLSEPLIDTGSDSHAKRTSVDYGDTGILSNSFVALIVEVL